MVRGLLVFLLAIAWARGAGAAECANVCWLDPGQLCVGSAGGRGFARLAEPGKPVQLIVERHAGSCGTLVAVDPTRVQASIADQPSGPFSPLTTTHDERHVGWDPPHPGDFYLRVTEDLLPGDGFAFVRAAEQPLAQPRVRVALPPGARKGWVDIRALPKQTVAALQGGFSERSWPWPYSGDDVLRTPTPIQLAPGAYQVRWAGEAGTALLPFELDGEPELRLELPRSSIRFAGKPPAEGWLLLVVDSDANVSERACLDSDAKKVDMRLYLPPGQVRVQWFRGNGACPFRRPSQAPLFEQVIALQPKATVRAAWPPATSAAKSR